MTVRNVKQLRSGQKFWWCDVPVTFIRATDHNVTGPRNRGSRRLEVSLPNGQTRGLTYWNDEKVTMVVRMSSHADYARLDRAYQPKDES